MRKLLLVIIGVAVVLQGRAQIIINEASYRNLTQVTDNHGDNPDWIELYNTGTEPVSLWQYHLSDDPANLLKWTLPNVEILPEQWLLIFASGKGRSSSDINHWETAVRDEDIWKWINPDSNTSAEWMKPGFNDAPWNSGPGGFGYGDGDDRTELPMDRVSAYTRISFDVSDISKIGAATLHMDYDDGFVAYLNGTEIARANMSELAWNSKADVSHEAVMYQGRIPEGYLLDMGLLRNLLHEGKNLLAVEVHNFTAGMIDMSLRAFLSFGLLDSGSQFGPLPAWFLLGGETELHTNFKISSRGETIFLANKVGILIDQLELPPNLPVNSSVGGAVDGSAVRAVFLAGTPNASNETQAAYTDGFEPAPVISLPGGFYPDSIRVMITGPSSGSEIRYTTNGQIPVKESPMFKGAPISIRNNTVLKARCFSLAHKLPGPVETATYFIGQDPTPAGILSITMETADLYGETGIYDNWWTDWKRQCYIEYFGPNTHQPVFKQYAGIKIEGGAGGSRSQPQHSFRIEPGNGALGDGDLNYPLIPSRTRRENYATFYIRNGSNQYLYYPCKDAIETKCMGDSTNNTYAGYAPVQVFLNGEYWGYYELREKLDEDFFKQYFGTEEGDLEILSVSYWYGGTLRAVEGNDPVTRFNDDYNRFLSLNSYNESFWDLADKIFDLEFYSDYICAQSFMANTDWPYNNIRIYRSPETGNRWRFSLIDLEWSLNPNGWSDSNMDHIRFMLDYDTNYPYIHIWQKAMQNKRFHDFFINRFADLLNTVWQKQRLTGIADGIYNNTRPELPATYQRWGDPNIPVSDYMNQFDEAHRTMISELGNRGKNVRNHLRLNFSLPKTVTITLNVEPAGSGTIRISTVKPEAYPWTGTYFDGLPVKIEALPNPGYSFSNWEMNSLLSDLANGIFLDTLKRSAIFSAHFKSETFSNQVIISEINYNSEITVDAGDWIEIWNYDKSLSASLNGWYFTDADSTHKYLFPENTVIGPDQRLVLVSDQNKFKTQHPGIPYSGSFAFGLGGSGDAVRLFNHKKELISSVDYDDVSPWPLGADGQGRTLELGSEWHPVGDPANWFDGCIGGSPGREHTPCGEPLVFSEINYQSESGRDHGDWVEIRNLGKQASDLGGWSFRDGVDSTGHTYLIPSGTILEPGQNIVLVQDNNKFREVNPGTQNFTGSFNFGLKDTGEWIRAYDESGKLRLSVRYNDKEPWPLLAGGFGYTLELVDPSASMNDGSNWMTGCIGGSPGMDHSPDCSGSGIPEISSAADISVYPNPALDKIFIDAKSLIPTGITLKNITGETVLYFDEPAGQSVLSIGSLPAGPYILIFQMRDGTTRVVPLIKQ